MKNPLNENKLSKSKLETITIKGAYGDANIGDDLLLEVIMSILKEVTNLSMKIKLVAKKANYLYKSYPEVTIVSLPSSKLEYSDIYILGGGTQFFSFASRSDKSKISIYWEFIKREPWLLLRILASKLSPRKSGAGAYYALGVGLGPFQCGQTENKVKGLMSMYRKVYCRDKYSEEFLTQWGHKDFFFGADLCLSSHFRKRYNYTKSGKSDDSPKLGLVLRDWNYGEYGGRINDIVLNAFNNVNLPYNLYSFSFMKDQELIRSVNDSANLFPMRQLTVWNPDEDNYSRFLAEFSNNDIIITSRYHAAIFALNFNIPVICIGIDPKLKALCEEVEGFYFWEISENVDFIFDSISKISDEYERHQLFVKESYEKLNKRSDQMINDFVLTVFGNEPK